MISRRGAKVVLLYPEKSEVRRYHGRCFFLRRASAGHVCGGTCPNFGIYNLYEIVLGSPFGTAMARRTLFGTPKQRRYGRELLNKKRTIRIPSLPPPAILNSVTPQYVVDPIVRRTPHPELVLLLGKLKPIINVTPRRATSQAAAV